MAYQQKQAHKVIGLRVSGYGRRDAVGLRGQRSPASFIRESGQTTSNMRADHQVLVLQMVFAPSDCSPSEFSTIATEV